MVDHINDVVDDLSNYGNWQEALCSANVTAHSSVMNYNIAVSGVVKNIADIYIANRQGPLRNVTIDQMRILTRTTARGTPSQYAIFGVDSNGNPNIRVRPIPTSQDDGSLFSILYYKKPSRYTTSDADTVIPFPARVVVLGTLAKTVLNENAGSPTPQYQMYFQEYLDLRRETLNRYNMDTGWSIQFRPDNYGRGRR